MYILSTVRCWQRVAIPQSALDFPIAACKVQTEVEWRALVYACNVIYHIFTYDDAYGQFHMLSTPYMHTCIYLYIYVDTETVDSTYILCHTTIFLLYLHPMHEIK